MSRARGSVLRWDYGLLAETITSVFTDGSVSAIFAGENQLSESRSELAIFAGGEESRPIGI